MRRVIAIFVVFASFSVASATPTPLPTLIAETEVAVWRCQDQLAIPRTKYSISPWKLPKSQAYRKWTLELWKQRRTACLLALHEQARQWNWQAWLPDKWRRIGICETQLNWRHSNGSHVSAFGISRQAYNQDAAVYGAPAWDDRRIPSPWNQYQAALGHYKLHGGFAGWGCRGA